MRLRRKLSVLRVLHQLREKLRDGFPRGASPLLFRHPHELLVGFLSAIHIARIITADEYGLTGQDSVNRAGSRCFS